MVWQPNAWLLQPATGSEERSPARLVAAAVAAQAGLVVPLAWQAMRGQPLTRPDEPTLLALAALIAVTGTVAALALRRAASP